MDLLAPSERFDRYQQRHPAWAVPMAVVRKFGNDQAGSLAALLAYYAFFSIFPLLLVFTTILAFVLQGTPSSTTTSRTRCSPSSRSSATSCTPTP